MRLLTRKPYVDPLKGIYQDVKRLRRIDAAKRKTKRILKFVSPNK